jgi:peptidoglycan/LPS O-acetylase OafA/YrhL
MFSGEEYIGNPETWTQFLAHLFLVHQIFEVESIFAGAWYVAIDWQLYVFLTLLLTVLDRFIFRVTALFVCIIFSLTYFNQHSQFDVYFFYFLVPYGLGILAFWASQEPNHRHRHLALTFFTVANIAILITTLFNPNIKNALSIFVALVLLLWGNWQYQNLYLRITQVIVWLSQRSYGAFLIHFSLILLGNTLFNQVLEQTPLNALIVILGICFLSWACAHLLYIWVELPSRRLQIFSTQPLHQN